jgi:HSP20 family protein
MAQNEKQGAGTESRNAAAGVTASAGTTGPSTPARGSPSTPSGSSTGTETGSEQSRVTVESASTAGAGEQQGGRLSRREGWDDPLASFFGGSPFALFRRLSDDMDRMFFGGTGQGLSPFGGFGGRFMPNVDVEDRDDSLVVRADLPGIRLEDFQVAIEDDALVLQGERRNEREENRGGMRRVERSYGSFRRVIPLPPGANTDAAQARFENGVLEIVIPVQQQSRSRRLEVQAGTTSTSSGSGSDPTRH